MDKIKWRGRRSCVDDCVWPCESKKIYFQDLRSRFGLINLGSCPEVPPRIKLKLRMVLKGPTTKFLLRCTLFCRKTPMVLWSQRQHCLYLTIEVADCDSPSIALEPEGRFLFEGHSKDTDDVFELELDLYSRVCPEVRVHLFG